MVVSRNQNRVDKHLKHADSLTWNTIFFDHWFIKDIIFQKIPIKNRSNRMVMNTYQEYMFKLIFKRPKREHIIFIASPKGELVFQSLEIWPLDGAGESLLGLELRSQFYFSTLGVPICISISNKWLIRF